MTAFNKISYSDSGSLDAFSRLRTSTPEILFSVQNQYNAVPSLMENSSTGTGSAATWQSDNRMILLQATSGTGTSYTQSFQYSPYQPGMSQFIAITGVLGTYVSGSTKEFGYFDANNGIIYRQSSGGTLNVVLRTSTSGSVVDQVIPQSSWNLDTLKTSFGNNPSGVQLNYLNSFILIIDLQFLGMGRVRVGFDIDGIPYYVHQFLNANNIAVPYMQTATLPIQALLTTSGTTTTSSMYFKCATVQSEGGNINFYGQNFSTPEISVTAGNNTRTALLAIRPRTTFNGVINRALFQLQNISLLNTSNQAVRWELMVGCQYSVQPTFTNVDTNGSAFEYSSATGTYTSGGTVIASGYMSSSANGAGMIELGGLSHLNYPITLNRAGAVRLDGTLSLIVSGIGSTANAVRATFDYTEIK